MHKVRNKTKLSLTEKIMYLIFISINLISSIVLVVLVGTKTIEWNWITGYTIGLLSSLVSLLLINFAVKQLIKTENHYLYYFLYIVRVGVYFIPFLLAFLITGTPFYYVGVIIGLCPVLLFTFINPALLKRSVNEDKYDSLQKELMTSKTKEREGES